MYFFAISSVSFVYKYSYIIFELDGSYVDPVFINLNPLNVVMYIFVVRADIVNNIKTKKMTWLIMEYYINVDLYLSEL